jgi:signal transduction histidine kinase
MERKQLKQFLVSVSAVLLVGAFLSFVLLAKTENIARAILTGYFYAVCVFIAIWLVQRLFTAKLSVFSVTQQWFLRAFLYTISISVAYLIGLVFQTIILLPFESLQEILIQHLWKGLVFIVSLPFNREASEPFLTPQSRNVLISFFAMMFLIGLVSLVGSYVEIRWQENRQRQAIERAELTALRAQIEPHFLFNSLNTIASLIRKNPPQAEKVLLQLSDILRFLFRNSSHESIDIKQEINFTRQYVSLLQARFEDHFQVDWRLSLQHEAQKVPALILQPVIENALRHGWPANGTLLKLAVSIMETERDITIVVVDNGTGITPEKLKQLPLPGHALENISDRLYLLFKKKDLLKITSREGAGTTVEITIPKSGQQETRSSKPEIQNSKPQTSFNKS